MSEEKINEENNDSIDNLDNSSNELIIDGVEDIVEPNPDDKVGDIIKRGRLSRNLSIETLSSSLKFSPIYIKAIEESRYKDLPALPYAKVYIKTIAEYLSLDSEMLLKEFMREVDGDNIVSDNINKDTLTIRVQDDKKNSHLVPILSVVALIIVLMLVVSNNQEALYQEELDVDTLDTTLILDEAEDTLDTTALPQDSLTTDSLKATDSISTKLESTKIDTVATTADSSNTEKKKLELTLTTVRDSSWVTVFSDGKKVQQGLIYHPKTIKFAAIDSINIKLGAKEAVIMLLNNRPLPIRGTGLKLLALRNDGKVEYWRTSRWKSTFSKRL
jgi:cytoskeletal protein RodZ